MLCQDILLKRRILWYDCKNVIMCDGSFLVWSSENCTFVRIESHHPVFPLCSSINIFLKAITIILRFDTFVYDVVVCEQSEFSWISNILVGHLYIPEIMRTGPRSVHWSTKTPDVTGARFDDPPSRSGLIKNRDPV